MKKMERLEIENKILKENMDKIKKALESVTTKNVESAYHAIGEIEEITKWIETEVDVAIYFE